MPERAKCVPQRDLPNRNTALPPGDLLRDACGFGGRHRSKGNAHQSGVGCIGRSWPSGFEISLELRRRNLLQTIGRDALPHRVFIVQRCGFTWTNGCDFICDVGIDHFYLYDNDSTDDYESVVRPFVNAGRVTLYRRPGLAQQLPVYQHCLREHRKDARWLTILDDDEFLFPAAASNLPETFSAYESYAGVAACWLLFGSNGHRTRPSGPVTSNYRRRAAWVDPHVKCVVDPAKVTATAVAAHSFHCVAGETIVTKATDRLRDRFAQIRRRRFFA